jgi:hypothetical protein
MIISAVAISPKAIVLGEPVDIIVLVEGAGPSRVVEVCVSVAWPFEIEGRAMLCQMGAGSPLSVSFRGLVTCNATVPICQITVLAAADDGQSCTALEEAEVNVNRRSLP